MELSSTTPWIQKWLWVKTHQTKSRNSLLTGIRPLESTGIIMKRQSLFTSVCSLSQYNNTVVLIVFAIAVCKERNQYTRKQTSQKRVSPCWSEHFILVFSSSWNQLLLDFQSYEPVSSLSSLFFPCEEGTFIVFYHLNKWSCAPKHYHRKGWKYKTQNPCKILDLDILDLRVRDEKVKDVRK